MDAVDVAVVTLAVVLIAGLGWFFFGPHRARSARLEGGVQRVEVTVRGGYSPDVIRIRQGIPLELVFDRQESGECTNRVVFPDLRVSSRPSGVCPHHRAGRSAQGRDLRVRLRNEHDPRNPARRTRRGLRNCAVLARRARRRDHASGTGRRRAPGRGGAGAAEAEAAEAAERQAEIEDLTRRVTLGAVLTAPVLFAVMAHELFGADWVPGWMLNHWFQLALVTPVMFYTGWPIHSTGWLTLRHRGADMNS